jgi:hypothetical protein
MGLPRGQSKVALSILVHSNAFVSGLTCDSVSSRFMGVREMPPPLIFLSLVSLYASLYLTALFSHCARRQFPAYFTMTPVPVTVGTTSCSDIITPNGVSALLRDEINSAASVQVIMINDGTTHSGSKKYVITISDGVHCCD